MEHKGDLVDQAAATEESFRDLALQAISAKAGPEKHPDFDGKNCLDCDREIEPQRLLLNRIRCVACQTKLEHNRKLYRR